MTTCLKFIKGELLNIIPNPGAVLWITENLFDQISTDTAELQFVKVQCTEPLQELIVYMKLQKFSDVNFTGCYLSPDFLPEGNAYSEKTPVTVTFLDLQSISRADSVEITLVKKEVMSWSEDEIEFAQNVFRVQNKVAYLGQKVKIHAGERKSVFGIVTKIYPEDKSLKLEAFSMDSQTLINLEGLPENRQKTIDFDKIGGLGQIISQLREIIQIPQVYPELYKAFEVQPPKGLLLFGPPGNGKTMIARAIAHSLGSKFVSIEGPELSSKHIGESEKRLREKFDQAAQWGNSVLFIDEIDSLASIRTVDNSSEFQISMVSSLLNLMDGLSSANGVFVIGATNRLSAVDPALRRPGRFELEFEIPLPDLNSRLDILQKSFPLYNDQLVDMDLNLPFLEHISQITHGYSGADIVSLYRLSVMNAISKRMQVDKQTGKFNLVNPHEPIKLTKEDVLVTIRKITPTSLRGADKMENKVLWEDLWCVEGQKEYLEQLHQKICLLEKYTLYHRPDFMNLIFQGSIGSGKKTLMRSFAQKFNYEWIDFGLTEYFSCSFEKLIEALEDSLQRCRQIAPSILYIENLKHFPHAEDFIIKLKASLSNLKSQYKIIVVISVETPDNLAALSLNGYRGFNHIVEFENVAFSDIKEASIIKYNRPKLGFEDFDDKKQPIGVFIIQIEEFLIDKI